MAEEVDIGELIRAKQEEKSEKNVEVKEDSQKKESSNKSNQKKKVLDQEVSIKINPRSLLKFLGIVLILALVFGLGRWTATPVDNGALSSLTGWATGIFDSKEVVPEPVEEKTTDPVENKSVEPIKEKPKVEAKQEIVETKVAEKDEKVVTTYTNTQFKLNDVKVDWKDTWGKIVQVDYTITNGEEGIIEADHIGVKVNGYGDFEKKVPLPASAKKINSGNVYEAITNVPGGFAYAEQTTGDLKSVKVTATLYDVNENVIETFGTSFNLEG